MEVYRKQIRCWVDIVNISNSDIVKFRLKTAFTDLIK